jgi:hypothetical protein
MQAGSRLGGTEYVPHCVSSIADRRSAQVLVNQQRIDADPVGTDHGHVESTRLVGCGTRSIEGIEVARLPKVD